MVDIMNDFNCFKNNLSFVDMHKTTSTEPYKGICGVTLFYLNTYLDSGKDFKNYFVEKLNDFNNKLLKAWTAECIEKL